MKTFSRISIALILMLVAVSCTQYRFFPFPLPDEDDSTPYDVSTSESFAEMLRTTGQVRLTSSFSVSDLQIKENGKYSINLNGNTLTLNAASSDDRLVIAEGSNVTINGNGGTLKISIRSVTDPSIAFIKLQPDSSLTLNNVTYNSDETGILVDQTAAELNINNSTIIAGGGYAVGTNASTAVEGIEININNSYLYANKGTGLLFNIPSSLNIVKSHIEGGAQALIVRNGTATIEDSELISNGNVAASGFDKYTKEDWGTGNEVPYATLVVGNRGSDKYDTRSKSCSVTDTSITTHGTGMAVYVASDNGISTTITLNGSSAEYANGIPYWGSNITVNNSQLPDNTSDQ